MFENHLFKPDSNPGFVSERLRADTYHEDLRLLFSKWTKRCLLLVPAGHVTLETEHGTGTPSGETCGARALPGPSVLGEAGQLPPGPRRPWGLEGLLAALPSPANKTRAAPAQRIHLAWHLPQAGTRPAPCAHIFLHVRGVRKVTRCCWSCWKRPGFREHWALSLSQSTLCES